MNTPTLHEEMDLLDEIERELVRLTTADLEAGATGSYRVFTPATPPLPTTQKTVIPAKAGTHTPVASRGNQQHR